MSAAQLFCLSAAVGLCSLLDGDDDGDCGKMEDECSLLAVRFSVEVLQFPGRTGQRGGRALGTRRRR